MATVNIARCPTHGLHGERTTCFVCQSPVEQEAMVPLAAVEPLLAALTRIAHRWPGESWQDARAALNAYEAALAATAYPLVDVRSVLAPLWDSCL